MEFGGPLGNAHVSGPFEREPGWDAVGGRGITPPPAHPWSDRQALPHEKPRASR